MSSSRFFFGIRLTASCLATPFLLTPAAHATLLIYEGFNYTTGSNLGAIKPNSNTVGLDQTTFYAGSGAANYAVQASSLSFGALQTTGGSVSFSTTTSVASGKLALASNYSGTLWSSYLVRFSTTQGGGATDGALLRISNDTANTGERFLSFADSRSSTTTVAVGYDTTPSSTGGTLTTATTYIIISKFTNVGMVLNTTTTGQSSIWALTEAQFGNFIAGGGTEAYLNSATVAGTATGVTARGNDTTLTAGSYSLASGNFAALVSVNDSGSFDELRYGTTLADVTPIPEPATAAAAGGLAALLAVLRRRRQATQRA